MPRGSGPRVVIVHDALVNFGGAERVLTLMREVFPEAPIYTAAYLPESTYPEFRSATIRTLPGSRFVRSEHGLRQLFPLWVAGFRSLRLDGADVVLSSTTWGAKFAACPAGTRHVSYCYAPNRLLWQPDAYEGGRPPAGWLTGVVSVARSRLRALDARATARVDRLATTCHHMAAQLERCYGRRPRVIYPPVRLPPEEPTAGRGDFYLTVARLMSYKRVDLAVKACTRLGRSLVVVGDGPEGPRLRSEAGAQVRFAGRITQEELWRLYARCRALIFPSLEDYGLAPLEAQAAGRPVIAYGAGGVLETVIDGISGIFFHRQDVDALAEAILRFEHLSFDPAAIRLSAARFSMPVFQRELRDFVLGA